MPVHSECPDLHMATQTHIVGNTKSNSEHAHGTQGSWKLPAQRASTHICLHFWLHQPFHGKQASTENPMQGKSSCSTARLMCHPFWSQLPETRQHLLYVCVRYIGI